MPSSCGMLVYSAETSRVISRQPKGNQGNPLSLFIKSVLSRTYDGSWSTLNSKKWSVKREIFSVGAPFEAMMGLPRFQGLYIITDFDKFPACTFLNELPTFVQEDGLTLSSLDGVRSN